MRNNVLLHLYSGTVVLITAFSVHALGNGQCSGSSRCGDEYITGVDNRVRPRVVQPLGPVLKSPCGGTIGSAESYQSIIHDVVCGEGAIAKNRLPLAVEKELMSEWDVMSRSGIADAQDRMQQMRQADISWSGRIEFPMWESWTYQKLVGDFNGAQCQYEDWHTTCARDREVQEEYLEDVTDYSNCLDWEEEPDYSSSESSSAFGGSPSTPSSNPYGSDLGSDSGSNSYESNYENHVDDAFDRYPDSIRAIDVARDPAGKKCIRYGTKKERRTRWVKANRLEYNCLKQRPRWCTWFVDQKISRSCPNHTAKFNLKYNKDESWKPGYVHAGDRVRDYHDLLPNKFDLLPGEFEKIVTYSTLGRGTVLKPAVVFDSQWNDYSAKATPSSLVCKYGMQPEIEYEVTTVGRKKAKSPNLLALPVEDDGSEKSPFEGGSSGVMQLPFKMELVDRSRAMMLQASMMSRTFPRPTGAIDRDEQAIHKTMKNNEAIATAQDMGFWVDTQFKVQLFRYDKWGRKVRMTPSNQFASNYVDMFDDFVTLNFENGRLPNKFYAGIGPLQSIFGMVWNIFGVELSPGAKYSMSVQILQRGLPFYESGCSDDRDSCEGEVANSRSFSEPLEVEFTAGKDVSRSLLRRLKDWQEMWVLF